MIQTVADVETLIARDDARYEALLAGNADTLDALLDDEFIYVHSSGREENKQSFVEAIRTGRNAYWGVEVKDRSTWIDAGTGVVRGHVKLDLTIAEEPRLLDIAFLAVWRLRDDQWTLRNWASIPMQAPRKTAS